MTARALAAQGYQNVKEFKGGKQEWFEAKLPFVGEHPDEPLPGKH
jgi:rhodanese-related sulfurtransferase